MVKNTGFSFGKSWIDAQLGGSRATVLLADHSVPGGPRVASWNLG